MRRKRLGNGGSEIPIQRWDKMSAVVEERSCPNDASFFIRHTGPARSNFG